MSGQYLAFTFGVVVKQKLTDAQVEAMMDIAQGLGVDSYYENDDNWYGLKLLGDGGESNANSMMPDGFAVPMHEIEKWAEKLIGKRELNGARKVMAQFAKDCKHEGVVLPEPCMMLVKDHS